MGDGERGPKGDPGDIVERGQRGERGPRGDVGSPGSGNGDVYPSGTPLWLKILLVSLQKFGIATILLLGVSYYVLVPLMNTYQDFIKSQARVSESQAETLKSLKDSEITRLKQIADGQAQTKAFIDKTAGEHAAMMQNMNQQLVDHKEFMAELHRIPPIYPAKPDPK